MKPNRSSPRLKRRFTDIAGPETKDICYATQNRQSAVRELSKLVDVLLVVGAKNSSNSTRLREIGAEANIPAFLIADQSELDYEVLREREHRRPDRRRLGAGNSCRGCAGRLAPPRPG